MVLEENSIKEKKGRRLIVSQYEGKSEIERERQREKGEKRRGRGRRDKDLEGERMSIKRKKQ